MASKTYKPLIVMDARMHRHSGIGTFIRNLTPHLASRIPEAQWAALLPDSAPPDWLPQGFSIIPCPAPIYSLKEQLQLPRRIPRTTRLFWSPHYNIPWEIHCPLMATLHDLNHLALSPSFVQNPLRHLYPRLMFKRLARQARQILCVSRFTLEEFTRSYPFAKRKTTYAHNGLDPDWFDAPPLPPPHPKPYLLFVGTVRPHKNLKNLLLAFAGRSRPETLDLIVAGPNRNFLSEDREALDLAGKLGASVRVTGELPKEQLQNLVHHAQALVLPSFYEGFGLPVLEAMGAGCPVLCSDLPPLREIAGDLALYFNPSSVSDILLKLEHNRSLAEKNRNEIKTAGIRCAKEFTWEKTADVYAQHFAAALEHP